MSSWSPEQYEKFKSERAQPFRDLLALIEHRPRMRVVDFGCGTGELTRALHDHLQAEESLGIDNSETMLLESASFGSDVLRFERGDVEAFVTDRPYDLVFSNAALHWIGDHPRLFTRLAGFLAPHGQLAVQMPSNFDHPSHRVAADLAPSFGLEVRSPSVLPSERYAELLHTLGFARQHVRLQVYGHVLPSSADVVEWVKGTTLTDYQSRLEPAAFEEFVARYRDRLLAEIGDARPYFYAFKRVVLWASF
ncbi:MAG: methyltransferase domain-containing protein [Acidobacteriota bacterium]